MKHMQEVLDEELNGECVLYCIYCTLCIVYSIFTSMYKYTHALIKHSDYFSVKVLSSVKSES